MKFFRVLYADSERNKKKELLNRIEIICFWEKVEEVIENINGRSCLFYYDVL